MSENAIQRIDLMTVLQVTFLAGTIVIALTLAVAPMSRRDRQSRAFPSAQRPCKVAAL